MTGRYVYCTIRLTVAHCQIFKQIWWDFWQLNLDTQMDSKTQTWVEKNSNGSPAGVGHQPKTGCQKQRYF